VSGGQLGTIPQAYGNSGLSRFGQPSQGMMGGYRPQAYTPMIFQPQMQGNYMRPLTSAPVSYGGMFGPGGMTGGSEGAAVGAGPSNNQGPTTGISVSPGLAGMALGPIGAIGAMGVNAMGIGSTPGAGNDADANAAAAANGIGMDAVGVGPGEGGPSNSNGPGDSAGGNDGGGGGGGSGK